MDRTRAIIADDEAPLRRFLRTRLAEAWPELVICAEAGNGDEALALIEQHRPDIAFLDIKMPGLSGMAVAGRIAGACRIVFVTAYDAFAVDAFEKQAVDYLLKPVSTERLEKTVARLKAQLTNGAAVPSEIIEQLVGRLNRRDDCRLNYIRVSHGDGVRLIPADEVIYFKVADKYTLVITKEGESLIRKPIKELVEELDPVQFWQIHRSTIVNSRFIAKVSRSLTGKGMLRLKDRPETLAVSSRYMHLFRQM